jgi:hypothetical protein
MSAGFQTREIHAFQIFYANCQLPIFFRWANSFFLAVNRCSVNRRIALTGFGAFEPAALRSRGADPGTTGRHMEQGREKRYDVLDGLRGVAAISVMLTHFSQNTPHSLFKHADLAVDLFFMLSGFVLMHSYRNKLLLGLSAREYIRKRIIRLYPMFAISMAA